MTGRYGTAAGDASSKRALENVLPKAIMYVIRFLLTGCSRLHSWSRYDLTGTYRFDVETQPITTIHKFHCDRDRSAMYMVAVTCSIKRGTGNQIQLSLPNLWQRQWGTKDGEMQRDDANRSYASRCFEKQLPQIANVEQMLENCVRWRRPPRGVPETIAGKPSSNY